MGGTACDGERRGGRRGSTGGVRRRPASLRACHGPGCVQFFVKDHPRREWCGPGCGNRARAARHYHRQRGHSA
ncbi:CGNR zinc finger domain-containing protein [Kitasatospora sp. NPDC001159]